ncbi:MAG: LysE family transporter [Pseudomonadota bacterium]
MDFAGLAAIVAAFAIVTASPGPAILALATCAMSQGRGPAVKFAFGLAGGLSLWGVIAATGVGVILLASEVAWIALRVAGGAYLFWLAWGAWRASSEAPERQTKQHFSFKSGFIFNCLNPKAVVAWMAALSMGLTTDAGAAQLIVATLVCGLAAVLINLSVAFAFSRPGMMSLYSRFKRQIQLAASGLFALSGFALLRSAAKG